MLQTPPALGRHRPDQGHFLAGRQEVTVCTVALGSGLPSRGGYLMNLGTLNAPPFTHSRYLLYSVVAP